MKAVCWHGKHDVRVESVPDPILINPRDAIIRVTSTAVCGSDLHLYNGVIPSMKDGDILGHEFMGEVIQVGQEVENLKPGDRVVVPFTIACGRCYYCKNDLWSLCDNSNPNAWSAEALYGYSPSGLFGYSHLYGGFAGGQAEYVRVPYADVGPFKVPENLKDEQVLFLSDILPTGYQAAEQAGVKPGDVVAVWGCGPVGQFAIQSAYLLGAERVIAIDHVPERLQMAQEKSHAETIDFSGTDVVEVLKEMTGGRGPDICIDSVGLEAEGHFMDNYYDKIKHAVRIVTDRGHVFREIMQACRKGGTVSIPGVYGGFMDKVNIGAAFSKGLTFRMGQTHVHRYMQPLLERIEQGQIDPTVVITHVMRLEDAPYAYHIFQNYEDNCIKVVLKT
jgi:threonine dehydrogenase-like Zn-dependent dehydrogenase